MKLFEDVKSIKKWRKENKNTSVAFVPTMGALHSGHLSLIDVGYKKANVVIISIFVNPTQFNNPEDLEKYPRTFANDLELLSTYPDILVFHPKVNDVYSDEFNEVDISLGALEEVMEGKHRPGHFKGVLNVVNRLFEIVEPNFACFGEKDFQQLTVIQHMVKRLELPIEIVPCPTSRETNGLAKSSRNLRLSDEQREKALIIFQTMQLAKDKKIQFSPQELEKHLIQLFQQSDLILEYLQIIDRETLLPLEKWSSDERICIAAQCGNVRLIDNMAL